MSGLPLRGLLGASLALNALLAAGLWHKAADTRVYWHARWTATPTPRATEDPVVGQAPAVDPGYMARRVAAVTPALAYQGEAGPALAAWRKDARAALAAALAYAPLPAPTEVRVATRATVGGVTREKVYMRLADGLWLPAYVLRPAAGGAPRAAVLALPGHDGPLPGPSRGAAAVAGLDGGASYMAAFGLRLAEAGHVVLAPELAGLGELAPLGYDALARQGALIGEPLLGRMLNEVAACATWLRTQPGVDAKRVGAVGLSLGGELAIAAAALDPGLAFAASAGFFTSYRELPGEAMAASFVPGLARQLDFPDVAALVAPRPLLVQADPADPIGATRGLDAAEAHVRGAYAGAGTPGAFTLQRHDRGHRLDVEGLKAWLARR